MSRHRITLYIIFTLCTLLACGIASGCSDAEPEVVSASSIVIFDYETENAAPAVKLAVFAETASDARRAGRFKIISRLNGFEWTAEKPLIMSDGKKQFVYYLDFVTPDTEKIPAGLYELHYTDAEERTVQSSFSVSYPEEILSSSADTAESFFGGRLKEQIAVYDKEQNLVYYGDRRDSWKEDKNIFSAYRSVNAEYYRVCLNDTGNSIMCMMPPVIKESGQE